MVLQSFGLVRATIHESTDRVGMVLRLSSETRAMPEKIHPSSPMGRTHGRSESQQEFEASETQLFRRIRSIY